MMPFRTLLVVDADPEFPDVVPSIPTPAVRLRTAKPGSRRLQILVEERNRTLPGERRRGLVVARRAGIVVEGVVDPGIDIERVGLAGLLERVFISRHRRGELLEEGRQD